MTRCSWPVQKGEDYHLCNRRATVIYPKDEVELPRCKAHDTSLARKLAETVGYQLVTL